MKIEEIFTSDLAKKMILVHPPEPRKEFLLSDPDGGIYIGKTRWMNTPVFWDPSKLINPHIAIVGITGSGKSYLVKTFLTRAALVWNSNAIILDWVGEYNEWVKQAGGRVINLAKEKLNLLDLVGSSKQERIAQILGALDVLADLKHYRNERDEIEEALENVYKKKKRPNLKDVVRFLEKKKHKKAARIIKRFTMEGSNFFSGKSSISIEKLTKSGLVSFDLHELPTEEIRSLAGLTILQFIKEVMRKSGLKKKKGVSLFVVLDEAWKIASDESSDVVTIVREGRKYNFGIIVATQNPTDIHKTIFSNVGTLFILRLVLKEYRDYIRNSIGYSEFIDREIMKFGVGDCALNMIFAERQKRQSTFLLRKIDGEEPLAVWHIKGGDDVDVEIEREQLIKMLYDLGLNDHQVNIVKLLFERYDGVVDADMLVSALEKFGYSKSSIISFLRQLGINEKSIVQIFSLAKMRQAKKGMINIDLED